MIAERRRKDREYMAKYRERKKLEKAVKGTSKVVSIKKRVAKKAAKK
jgi:hypothetical protein